MAPGGETKLTVWYNTKCPVCNAGTDWQRNRLIRAARSGAIEFRDVNLESDALSGFGVSVDDVRRRLHAIDENGKLSVGIDCVMEIWDRTPGDGWLARILRMPGLYQLARIAYDRFADGLFAWNRWMRHW